jgi:hypothetical protein
MVTEATPEVLKEDGTGYLQRNFVFDCAACGKATNHEGSAVMKFARDYTCENGSYQAYLAWVFLEAGLFLDEIDFCRGTLHTPYDPCNLTRANTIRKNIGVGLPIERPKNVTTTQWRKNIANTSNWSKALLFACIARRIQRGGQL